MPAAFSPDQLVERVAVAASRTPGLLVAFLFGSQLTGRTWVESDVDIAIRWDPLLDAEARLASERQLLAQLAFGLESFGDRVDLVDLDRAGSSVAFAAVRDGRLAWSRSEAARIDSVVRVARRYDDEAPMRERFRAAARAAAARLAQRAERRT